MFRFGDELFFTGRASCSVRAEEGRQKAYEAAIQEVLNYTQAPRLTGVPIETQMLFEEYAEPGCPPGTHSWTGGRCGRSPPSRRRRAGV